MPAGTPFHSPAKRLDSGGESEDSYISGPGYDSEQEGPPVPNINERLGKLNHRVQKTNKNIKI
jgi:hypothetical protein